MKIIECPRDAMQGIKEFIPTEKKVAYINSLLKIGFDTIDFGSFVSPKAVPQMKDTVDVLQGLELGETNSSLLAIIANLRGAETAGEFDEIEYLGFPFSVSETFQKRNTNSSIEESLETVELIKNLCSTTGQKLVVYLSMGFGNPYGDFWHEDIVASWTDKLVTMEVDVISVADTVAAATPETIRRVFGTLSFEFPHTEFGVHLHTTPDNWKSNVEAAYASGCRRFDGALKGYGGCPFAKDELTGNLPTENLLQFLKEKNTQPDINEEALVDAMNIAGSVFPELRRA